MSEVVLRWEAPPGGHRKPPGHWQSAAIELEKRAGEWGLMCEGETAHYAYDSVARSLRRWGCEVRTKMVDGKVSVWARWPT